MSEQPGEQKKRDQQQAAIDWLYAELAKASAFAKRDRADRKVRSSDR